MNYRPQLQLRNFWAIGCACALIFVFSFYTIPSLTSAHGTNITYDIQSTVLVQANFDTGEPMANAQISVFAPDDPETPWLQGTADENGDFTFVPDSAHSGSYDVRIRSAGHGEILSIPIAGGPAAAPQTSVLQQIIMGAAIIWGFMGTALYFSSRNATGKSEGTQEYAHS